MKKIAPVLTIAAVAVAGAALFAVDVVNDPAAAPRPAAASDVPPPAAAPEPAPDPAPASPAVTQKAAVAEKVYAGRSSGNEVTVAIAVKDGRAVAYVCDGKKVEAWLEGTLTGAALDLRSADGAATVTGTLDEAKSLGTVTVGEKQWPFAAKGVVAPAGLYEGRADVRGVAGRIGWIVLGDGSQTGAVNRGGVVAPAPELDPADLGGVAVDGVPVQVRVIGGDDVVVAR